MKPFKPANSTGQVGGSTFLDRMLDAVASSFDSLARAVTNDVLVRATLSSSADTPVTHGLGFAPRTWEIVDQNANAVVWQSPVANPRAASVILLRASAAVTVLLRFT